MRDVSFSSVMRAPAVAGHERTRDSATAAIQPPLRGLDMAVFDALLHDINPDAPRADIDRMYRLADWLAGLPDAQAEAVIDARLGCASDLRCMLADDRWAVDDGLRARAERLLAYVDRMDDLIADTVPRIGRLDDALLIELCWPMFADDVSEYLDYAEDCNTAHGAATRDIDSWRRDCRAESLHWRRQVEITWSHYIQQAEPPPRFRVD